jgi:hypothetical protein
MTTLPCAHLRNLAHVQSQRDPALRCDVGGQIKSARLRLRQRLVVAEEYLAGDRDDAITVMVIEEVSESLLPDEKLRVRSVNLASGPRQRKSNLD